MILNDLHIKNNANQVLKNLLDALGVQYTISTIAEFENHPHYPSLLAYSDVLNGLQIQNMSLKLERSQFTDLPTPFITHHNIENGVYIVVTAILGDKVVYKNGGKGFREVEIDDFLSSCTGTFLIVEANGTASEDGFSQNKHRELWSSFRWPFICAAILGITLYGVFYRLEYFPGPPFVYFIFLFAYLAGLAVSTLLLIQSIDRSNSLVKRFCGLTEKMDCNGVLDSPAAKLLGIVSWSEIGFVYFAGSLLVFLFSSVPANILALLNVLTLPYTLFSVYYQWKIIRQWCAMCLTVQVLLWIIFLCYALSHISPGLTLKMSDFTQLLLWFTIPGVILALFGPFVHGAAKGKLLKEEINKFKGSDELFYAFLKQQPSIDIPATLPTMVLGNPDSALVMSIVTNPYCGPCTDAHKKMQKVLKVAGNDMKIQIIFSVGMDENDLRFKVASHMMSLYYTSDEKKIADALEYWYNMPKKDFNSWSRMFPAMDKDAKPDLIKQHSRWCQSVPIEGTPAIFINGYSFPSIYDLEDLKYIARM